MPSAQFRRQLHLPLDPREIDPRPFLKWAGGKGQLLAQLDPLLPEKFGRYFEPFLGGGALFFSLQPRRAVLSDMNAELVDTYVAVRDSVEEVISALTKHRYARDYYERVRSWKPEDLEPAERAARMIFLNRTGFNGLYRVNKKGAFNVPFGRYTEPKICDPTNLRSCSRRLQAAKILFRDFSDVAKEARKGDFVYFDPPYVPVSKTSDFTSYVSGGFGWEEQERLAQTVLRLSKKGVYVMLSNSDTEEVRLLYKGFQIDRVHANRAINSKGERRGKVAEVVVRTYETRL